MRLSVEESKLIRQGLVDLHDEATLFIEDAPTDELAEEARKDKERIKDLLEIFDGKTTLTIKRAK